MSPKDRAGAEGREPEEGREEAEARPGAEGLADADLAAAGQALAQARAAARAKGLRPGKVGKRRVRDVPVDARRDSGRDPQLIGDEVSAFVSARGWQGDPKRRPAPSPTSRPPPHLYSRWPKCAAAPGRPAF